VEPVPFEVRLELGARRRFHAHDLVHLHGVGASKERENESVRDRSTLPLRDRLTDCEYGGERATGIARLKQQQRRRNLSPTHREQSRQSRLILATRHEPPLFSPRRDPQGDGRCGRDTAGASSSSSSNRGSRRRKTLPAVVAP
jgi:hypothetical protein